MIFYDFFSIFKNSELVKVFNIDHVIKKVIRSILNVYLFDIFHLCVY